MTYDHYRAARTFRRVMDQPTESNSQVYHDLQASLITEEFQEFMDAHVQEKDFHTLKELADLAYVAHVAHDPDDERDDLDAADRRLPRDDGTVHCIGASDEVNCKGKYG